MSERDRYEAGVPCWVTALSPDPPAATAFYGAVFGWEFAGSGPDTPPPGEYFVARLRGRDVAGVAPLPPQGATPGWITEVRVDSADDAARRAAEAGGTVLAAFDADPAGRLAVLADPAGAVLCAWEARTREGAQRVNE